MTLHNTNETCFQEDRIVRLEEKMNKKHDDIESLKTFNTAHSENIQQIMLSVTELTATLNTLKWIITIAIALFGAVFAFLIIELIKIIH